MSVKAEYLVIHTAAHGNKDNNYDTTVEQIQEWHLKRGWKEIGYHFVIRLNGDVTTGERHLDEAGAHVAGLNSRSYGICMSGHGDFHNFTENQYNSLIDLCIRLMKDYNIPVEKVIGHREINNLI